MRKPRKLLCFLIAAALCVSFASAHPGKTDSQGGHYNHATGEYHFHHGYPAHQHPNGVCPYDFDDQTGMANGGESGTVSEAPPITGIYHESEKNDHSNEKSFWDGLSPVLIIGFSLLVGAKLICSIPHGIRWLKTRKQVKEEYGGKTPDELAKMCGMPDGTCIGDDGRPHKSSDAHYRGDLYTVYISKTGKRFHRNNRCTAGANIPIHIFDIKWRTSCDKCCPVLPNLSWYQDYKKLLKKLSEYNISPKNKGE